MKGDRAYLLHVRDAIDQISQYAIEGHDAFFADRKTQDAVIRQLEIIGEAVKQLSDDIRSRRVDLPWKAIAGMRDVLIHHYFGVKLDLVWQTVKRDLPPLREGVEELLAALPDEEVEDA